MLLYNCATWVLTKTIEDRLNSFHGRLLRSTSAQKAMEKYFDAPYIPSKKRPKTTLTQVLENDLKSRETPLYNRENLEKLKMLAAD